jgi:SAM-dependent methyltransferase
MTSLVTTTLTPDDTRTPSPRLIRRVNALFHDLSQDVFDDDHAYRHRTEAGFWSELARRVAEEWGIIGALQSKVKPRRNIVDLACGSGFVTLALSAHLGHETVIHAIDISERALEHTRRKWARRSGRGPDGPELQTRCGPCDAIGLPAASVDVVTMNAALHHLPDPGSALEEIDRVLRPGGLFALGFEPNRGFFESPILASLAKLNSRIAWYLNPKQNRRRWKQLLGRAGIMTASAAQECETTTDPLETINRVLVEERLICQPLRRQEILDLVDPHARSTAGIGGFDVDRMLQRYFPAYSIEALHFTDYLGIDARRAPWVRFIADRIGSRVRPKRGSLFSWVIRKPSLHTGPDDRIHSRQPSSQRGKC